MPAPLYVATNRHPTLCPGRVLTPGKDKDKLLALRHIKPLHRGAEFLDCSCEARFANPDHLANHTEKQHPPPPPPVAKKSPPVEVAPVKPAEAATEPKQEETPIEEA